MSNVDLGQVFTRRILADYMVSLFTLKSKSVVLDPCFGGGVFIDSVLSNTDYSAHGYELDADLYDSYKNNCRSDVLLYKADFLLNNFNAKYDGIIMNPPYIRHEKIDELENYGISKNKLSKSPIYSKLPKTANLYMYFVVKAIDTLKANGELIVIFPESWLNSKGGETFRNYISIHCSVEKRIHVSGRAFEKDALVDVIILKLKKNASMADCAPLYVSIDENNISKREMEYFHQDTVNKVPFSAYALIRRGLSTGCNKVFINPLLSIDTKHLTEIISSPKSVCGYSTKNAVTDKLLVIKNDSCISDDLKLYLKNWENDIRKTGKPKTLAMKIKNGDRWYSINNIDCKGIIFGYMIRNDMRFIINESSVTVRDNFYIISPNIDCYIMLALLNNYYVYTQLEANGRKYGGGMLKLQKYDVDALKLTNLSVISDDDKFKLKKLARQLTETSDKSVIDEISAVLAEYESVDMETIKSQYEYMRLKRLENGK
jgi:Type I restriction-modification system methyltransferase subunit